MIDTEFKEDMRSDAYAARYEEEREAVRDWKLSNDYEEFRKYFEMEFEDVEIAIKTLQDLHKQYEHEWDIREHE